jgi:hypothetical protein
MLILAGSALAQGRYREQYLAPAAGYGHGLNNFQELDNIMVYNLWYSYWMNDTSTLDISLTYLESSFDVSVINENGPAKTAHPSWDMFSGQVGMRYIPAWDFFLDFGFGAGLGYEGWSVSRGGDDVKGRSGSSLVWYLLADVEYPIRPWLSLGFFAKPYYFPLHERLEKTVINYADGQQGTEYDKLKNGFIIDTGLWLMFRIY